MPLRLPHRQLWLAWLPVALLATACDGGNGTATASPTVSAEPSAAPSETAGGAVAGTCAQAFPEGLVLGQPVPAKFVCIDVPLPESTISGRAGASTLVSGWVAGAFEQNVVIEIRDDADRLLAMAPATAVGTELGLFAARWELTLMLESGTVQQVGSVRAFTTSARDGSVETDSAVNVRFE